MSKRAAVVGGNGFYRRGLAAHLREGGVEIIEVTELSEVPVRQVDAVAVVVLGEDDWRSVERHPLVTSAPTVAVTVSSAAASLGRALRCGLAGVVSVAEESRLLPVVVAAAQGETLAPTAEVRAALAAGAANTPQLDEREHLCIRALLRHGSPGVAARHLPWSLRTVQRALRAVRERHGLRNNTHLLSWHMGQFPSSAEDPTRAERRPAE